MLRSSILSVSLLLLGCAPGASLSLQLQKGDPALPTDTIQTLNVLIDDQGDQELVFFHPFTIDFENQRPIDNIQVDRDSVILVEVWGCDSAQCALGDVDFRGCADAPIDIPARVEAAKADDVPGETVAELILLHDKDNADALEDCPVLPLE